MKISNLVYCQVWFILPEVNHFHDIFKILVVVSNPLRTSASCFTYWTSCLMLWLSDNVSVLLLVENRCSQFSLNFFCFLSLSFFTFCSFSRSIGFCNGISLNVFLFSLLGSVIPVSPWKSLLLYLYSTGGIFSFSMSNRDLVINCQTSIYVHGLIIFRV